MTWMTLIMMKLILRTVSLLIQHIPGHSERPWSELMLQSGDKLLWTNWLLIRQMGHELLLIDLWIDQLLGQSGCSPRSIVLMALLSATRVDWSHRASLSILNLNISRYLLQQCTYPLYASSLHLQPSTTSISGLLMSQMHISMAKWTGMSIWSSQRALNREIARR